MGNGLRNAHLLDSNIRRVKEDLRDRKALIIHPDDLLTVLGSAIACLGRLHEASSKVGEVRQDIIAALSATLGLGQVPLKVQGHIELIFNHDGLLEVKDIMTSSDGYDVAFDQWDDAFQTPDCLEEKEDSDDLLKQALDAEDIISSSGFDLFADLTSEDLNFLEDVKPRPAIQEATVGSTSSHLSFEGFSGYFDGFKPDPLELESSLVEASTSGQQQPPKRGRKPKLRQWNDNWSKSKTIFRPGGIKRRQKTLRKVEYPFIIILGLALQSRMSSRTDHIYNFVQRYFRKKTENVQLWRGSVRHALNTKKFFQKYNKAWCKGKVWGLRPDAIGFAVQSALSAFELNRDEYVMAMTHPDPELFDAMVEVLRNGPSFENEDLPQERLSPCKEPQESTTMSPGNVNISWNNNDPGSENSNLESEINISIQQLPQVPTSHPFPPVISSSETSPFLHKQPVSKMNGFGPILARQPFRDMNERGFSPIPVSCGSSTLHNLNDSYDYQEVLQTASTCVCGLHLNPWDFHGPWWQSTIQPPTDSSPSTNSSYPMEGSANMETILSQVHVDNISPPSSALDLDEKDVPDLDLSKSEPGLEDSLEGPSLTDITQQYINMNW
ncbi:hypothetical protein TCAL_16831 [Tigriopus californicus]|uniref:Fork-head domain-containing protein n=1 Tax=Tigriopus californicus TaxID=6832 RepID=A0A553PC59_TIGCA|nr:hypothetical protein TCAL_16831 [Tigriopus californicus]